MLGKNKESDKKFSREGFERMDSQATLIPGASHRSRATSVSERVSDVARKIGNKIAPKEAKDSYDRRFCP